MFGIPDIYSCIPNEDKSSAFQMALDSLEEKGAISLDFDGKMTILPKYKEYADVICDCDVCIAVNRHDKNGVDSSIVFWSNNGSIYRADIVGELYCITMASSDDVRISVESNSIKSSVESASSSVSIINATLQKVKRLALEGRMDDAMRELLQNGCNEHGALVILDSLTNQSDYFCLSLITPEEESIIERAWIGSRDTIFELSADTVGFRPSTTFSASSSAAVCRYSKETLDRFLG